MKHKEVKSYFPSLPKRRQQQQNPKEAVMQEDPRPASGIHLYTPQTVVILQRTRPVGVGGK
ncbi:MAG TPA: hypothetical protein VK787_11830, partial [Puia sp.]|nr:hypothetical protein [Puia sp.]